MRYALRFLLITLAVTPLRKRLGWNWLLRFRRMLGLYAFFYGVMHASSYAGLDQVFDFPEILADIVKRPIITVGFAALLLMIPLAVTSTNAMVRRLGAAQWQALHRPCLRHRVARRAALLVDGEARCHRAGDLRACRACRASWLPRYRQGQALPANGRRSCQDLEAACPGRSHDMAEVGELFAEGVGIQQNRIVCEQDPLLFKADAHRLESR